MPAHGGREEIVHVVRLYGRGKSMVAWYYQAVNDWLNGKKNPGLLITEKPGIRRRLKKASRKANT